MTSQHRLCKKSTAPRIAALAGALAAGDERLFFAELDALVQRRERDLFGELRKLTSDLQSALERFSVDSRLVDLAEKEVPDARHASRSRSQAHRRGRASHDGSGGAVRSAGGAHGAAGRRASSNCGGGFARARSRSMSSATWSGSMDVFLEAAARGHGQGARQSRGSAAGAGLSGSVGSDHPRRDEARRRTGGRAGRAGAAVERRRDDEARPRTTRRGFGPAVPGIDHGPAVSGQQDVDRCCRDWECDSRMWTRLADRDVRDAIDVAGLAQSPVTIASLSWTFSVSSACMLAVVRGARRRRAEGRGHHGAAVAARRS